MYDPLDDRTPIEQDPQNEPVIRFLNRVYNTTNEPSPAQQTQAIARVRERLFRETATPARPHLYLVTGESPTVNPHDYLRNPARTWKQRFGLLTVAALLTLVVGSGLLIFSSARQAQIGSGPTKTITVTPAATAPVSMHDQALVLVNQLRDEANSWGSTHRYHNTFDGRDYSLTAGYTQAGLGGILDNTLANARSNDDYQAIIDLANDGLFNLRMLEANFSDPTPYNQPYKTDLQLLDHYHLKSGTAVIVSTVEQAMRVYQNGKLVSSFQVTTGRVEHPSLPGNWTSLVRRSPATFKSSVPKDSPDWYPDVTVQYAIQYHTGSYYVSDSWWRTKFGPGTQFPHTDPSDNAIAQQGTQGSIDMSVKGASWLYAHTNNKTHFIIY